VFSEFRSKGKKLMRRGNGMKKREGFSLVVLFLAVTAAFILLTIFLSTCELFSPGFGDSVDINAPKLDIDSHGNGDYVSGEILLSGTAEDDQGIKSVTIKGSGFSVNAAYSKKKWSGSVDTTLMDDGEYEFIFTAFDTTGKSAKISLYLIVDNSPPTVMVTSPGSYTSQEFNQLFTIKGEAVDTSRVQRVQISLYTDTGAEVFTNVLATGTSSWYLPFDSESLGIGLGGAEDYYFIVEAEDFSGNVNPWFYHFDDIVAITNPGQTPSSIEEIHAADYKGVPIGVGVLTSDHALTRKTASLSERMMVTFFQDSDKPDFLELIPDFDDNPEGNVLGMPQRLSFFAEDDDGIDKESLTIDIYDASDNIVESGIWSDFTITGTQWTYETNLPDGEYYFTLYVEDIHGKSNELPPNQASFRVSSFAPVVQVTSPPQGSFIGDSGAITVEARITGLGGGEVWLDWDDDDNYEIQMSQTGVDTFSVDLTEGTTTGNIPFDTEIFDLTSNGEFPLRVRAGTIGNYGYGTLQLIGDIEPPAGTITSPGEAEVVNGIFTMRGEAKDVKADGFTGYVETVYLHVGSSPSSPEFPGDFTDLVQDYTWSYNLDTNLFSDGTYTASIIVKDAAGNFSELIKKDFEIMQSSDLPVISLSSMTVGGTSDENHLGRDPSIIGLVEDDDSVDVSTLEIRVDEGTWISVTNIPAADGKIVSWSHVLSGISQGVHSMQVRVRDTEGNLSTLSQTGFIVDYGPPDLSVNSPINNAVFNTDFTIDITAADANGLQLVKIVFNGSDEHVLLEDAAEPYDQLTYDGSYLFPVDSGGDDDGEYTYQVVAVDASGGTSTVDRGVVVDATPPVIVIEQPEVLSTVNGTSVIVRGTANDNRMVSAVYADINPDGTSPEPDITDWDFHASGTYTWNLSFDSFELNGSSISEEFIISVRSMDGAGNISDAYTRSISIDQSSDRPKIDFNDIDKYETVATSNVLVGATTLTGTIEDDDLVDPALFSGKAIEISIDGAGWEAVSEPPVSAGKIVSWKHDISSLPEGLHRVKLRVRDNQSNGTVGISSAAAEYTTDFNWNIEDSTDQSGIPFILNLGPPSITIATPANYSYNNSDLIISGTAVDANEVATVEVSLDNGVIWTDLGVPSGPTINWSYTMTVNPDGSDDGVYAYLVRAIDTYGSASMENGQFTVDATAPTAVINQPLNGDTVNGTIVFSGTANDNITLASAYYSIQESSLPDPAFPGGYTLLGGSYSWSDILDTSGVADGSYTLRVVPVDTADNQGTVTSIDFNVDQESDRPVISFSSVNETGSFSENLLPGAKQVVGTVIDDDKVDVSTIEYRLFEEDGSTLISAITPDWTAISGPPALDTTLAAWSHTFGTELGDGKYQLALRAADTFDAGSFDSGGYGWSESSLVKFAVDTANPLVSVISPLNGGYINHDFTIHGSASDANGVQRVQIQYGTETAITLYEDLADPYETSVAWSNDVDVDTDTHVDDGILNYSITVTDVYGKITTTDRYINIDTQKPLIDSLVLVNNDQTGDGIINGSALIQGSPLDHETMVTALYLRIDTAIPDAPGADPTIEGWELLSGTTNINKRFNSTLLTDSTPYAVYLIVEDRAGNRTAPADYSLSFTPVQAGNIPLLSIDTPDDSLLRYSDTISGTIYDDDGVDVSTIEISFDNGSSWHEVSTHSAADSTNVVFSHFLSDPGTAVSEQISSFNVQVRAFDTGEDFLDDEQDILPAAAISDTISVNVDNSEPTASIIEISNGMNSSATLQGIYINDRFILTGTAADGVQVAEVRAKLDGDAGFVPVTDTGTNFSTWSWSRTALDIGADSVVVSLEVEDSHGRTSAYSYTLLVDEAAPLAGFLTEPGTYHGSLNIRGSSSDNVLVTKVYLAHGAVPPADPVGGDPANDPDYSPLGSTYSWGYILNTLDVNPTDADQTYYVSVVALDGAGNLSVREDLSFIINQGSDRPNISFSNVTAGDAAINNLLESNAKVLGSADDDDGLASIEFATSEDDENYGPWTPVTTDGSTPVSVSGINLNWQNYVADLGEGVHYIRFRVRDTEYVDAMTPFNEVLSSTVAFTIDSGAPVVNLVDFEIENAYGAGTINKAAAAGTLINNSFLVSGTADDGTVLSSVEISTDGSTYLPVDTLSAPDWSHTIAIPRDGTMDGSLTLYVTAVDQFAKSTTVSLPVNIDTTEPEIIPTQPAGMDQSDPPNVNGTVNLRGSVTEANAITGFTAVGGLSDDVALTNSGTNLNWVIELDSDQYADPLYAVETEPGSSNLWRFPIDVSASDAAGNLGAEVFQIDIDPDSDKPLLFMTSPSDSSSVAGAFIVQGTVSDDDGIQKVTIQIDLDDDGLYTSSYDLDGSSTTGDADFENESVPVDISVTNGSWNILMNQSNELSKANLITAGYPGADGWIRIKVVPYDVDNTRSGSPNLAGEATEVRIYIDSTAPVIEGQGQALPDPANGTIVSGMVPLSARFKDDMPLTESRMQISYDGGVSFQRISAAGGSVTDNGLVEGYYEYDIELDIDTSSTGGIVAGGNGILQTVLRVTDETFKQNTMSIQFNVDNTLPMGVFNYKDDLAYIGSPPDEIYSFYGDESSGGDYLLIGSAEDTGTISGIESVRVYFVKGGNFYNPSTGVTSAVSSATVSDMSGTDQLIPFTENPSLIIDVDKRSERGIYDSDPSDGDADGFQESLLSKGTYDEWFVYFDTSVFPDGPMDMYTVVYDTAGNYAHDMVSIQIVNNPPVIDSIEIDGIGTLYSGLFKRAASVYLKVNASDLEGIDSSSYTATVTRRRVAPNGADDPTGTPMVGTAIDIADTGDGSNADDITLDISGWESGVQYTLEIEVLDTDGNVVRRDVELWVNNSDSTPPTVEIDDLDQGNITSLYGHIDEAGFSLNDGSRIAAVVGSVAGDRQSFTSAGLIGNSTIQTGWTAAFETGEWRTISEFDSGSGTISFARPLDQVPGGNATLQAGEADISGVITFTGTAYDDTIVNDVEISFDSGTTWYSVDTLSHVGGDDIVGHDYQWEYTIDTANPAEASSWTTAALDQTIMVRATDGTSTGVLTFAGISSDKIVDIVPYISEINRLTPGLKTNRSRYGRYSLYHNETGIQVSGFNLNPSSAGLYTDAGGSGTPDPLTVSNINTDFSSFELATGGTTRSGWLGIRVNGIDAINNINDNQRDYNGAYGTDRDEDDWNDDRYFFMFKVGEYFGPDAASSYSPQHPAMTIHPGTSRLFGAWSSYGTSDVFFASANTDPEAFRSRVYHTYDTAEHIDISMDATTPTSTGRLALAWLANNSSDGDYSDGHVSSFPYERNTNFIDGDVDNDGAANLPANYWQWSRSGFDNWYYQGEGLSYDNELFQFTQVRTARYNANVHWAYHDTISNTVKYQYVSTADNDRAELQDWVNIDGTDTDTDGGENNRMVTNGIARTTDAGEFLSLTLDEDYYPVVVYYDNVGKTLRLARTGTVAPQDDENQWTRQEVFRADDPNKDFNGKHISAIVDDQGYLHISFWSDDTGYLYYIKSNNNPENGDAYTFEYSQIVDDSGTAGIYSDITLNRTPGTDEPYIAYLNSARMNTRDGIKIAYYDSLKGGWEYVVIANNTIVTEKRVSVEYARGGSPDWQAAFGYASVDRFELNYLMPEVP
jgi:hypothetical protein